MYNLEKIKKKEGKETLITTQTMSQNSGGLIFDQSAFVTDLQEAISVLVQIWGLLEHFKKSFTNQSICMLTKKIWFTSLGTIQVGLVQI